MRIKVFILLLTVLFTASSCATMGKRTQCVCKGAAAGAAIGATTGVIIGNQGDVDNKVEGSLIGAATGGIIGGAVGFFLCKEEADTDGDGVLDGADRCPGTPMGVEVDENGCPVDTDGDGVPDYLDKCPDTPKGAKVDSDGCPVDTDEDGVPDYLDRCPDTPKGSKVDNNGCPLVGEKLLILQGINFKFDSAEITEDSKLILDKVVDTLANNPSVKVRIDGHTDSTGPEEYNLKLSQKRADAVKHYLIEQGIAAERLTSIGKGEGSPIASNETKEGRAQNRRVEFVVTEK